MTERKISKETFRKVVKGYNSSINKEKEMNDFLNNYGIDIANMENDTYSSIEDLMDEVTTPEEAEAMQNFIIGEWDGKILGANDAVIAEINDIDELIDYYWK